MASIKVAVRVRPMNQRESQMESTNIIQMKGKTTTITNTKLPSTGRYEGDHGRERQKEFTYDFSYWSSSKSDPNYTSQEQVFKDLGSDVIRSAFEGYNACIFAYGQTGSGKTYTMMGEKDEEGLIPRICKGLFSRMKSGAEENISYRTEVSYLEIYNERVRDLLRKHTDHTLRVREHPKDGPYVQDLSKHLVVNYEDIEELMNKGNFHRATASTSMNDSSSRSHAIFTIVFTQAKFHKNMPSEMSSKIHLVDLAGSERADATGATGQRLKEGASINKSLVTLGNVISVLADLADRSSTRRQVFIPYRDSVLTWLLKDSLGGNAKTIMVATISPANVNYGESLSTLRYANRAKNIINKPTVNEDSNVKLIRELRAEIARLKALLGGNIDRLTTPKVQEKLCENEARVKVLTEQWAEKWKEAHSILQEEKMALRKEGLGVILDSELPHLIGIDDDILSTGIMLYHLKEGKTTVGTADADFRQDIVLSGLDVEDEHCYFIHEEGTVMLHPVGNSLCVVNGTQTQDPVRLFQGAVILLGKTNMFRFNHPAEAKQLRKDRELGSNLNLSRWSSLSQSITDLAKSTDSLYNPGTLEMEERHREQIEELEDKRKMIEDMEERHRSAEQARRQEQLAKEREIEEKRAILEKMQEEADAMKKEAEMINSRIRKEEARLNRKSTDLEKQLQDYLIEKEKFHEEKQQEREKLQQEKARELERRKEERDKFENEKAEQMLQIQEAMNELAEHEAVQIEQARAAKEELMEALQKLEQESLLQKAKIEEDWKRLEQQEKMQLEKVTEAEAEILKKQEELQHQKDEELSAIAHERAKLEELKLGSGHGQRQDTAGEDVDIVDLDVAGKELEEREKQVLGEIKRKELELAEKTVVLGEQEKKQLENERLLLSDLAKKQAADAAQAKAALDKRKSDLESKAKEEMVRIEEERKRLALESQSVEECNRQDGYEDEKTRERRQLIAEMADQVEFSKHNLGQLEEGHKEMFQEELEKLEKRMEALKIIEDQFMNSETELQEKRLKFETERQQELDRIEVEKFKLQELENQERINALVEQEVKKRVFEEKKQREKRRKMEREKDRKEREQEMIKIKRAHDKEIQQLRQKYESNNSSGPAIAHQSRANPYSVQMNTDTGSARSNLHKKYPSHDSGLLNVSPSAEEAIKIQIPAYTLRGYGLDTHYEYEVKVTVLDETWTLYRRYSKFRDLHFRMKNMYPDVCALTFPPKRFFGSRSEKIVAERRSQLEDYLMRLLQICARHPKCPLHSNTNKSISKHVLWEFSSFFKKGIFEISKHGTC